MLEVVGFCGIDSGNNWRLYGRNIADSMETKITPNIPSQSTASIALN